MLGLKLNHVGKDWVFFFKDSPRADAAIEFVPGY